EFKHANLIIILLIFGIVKKVLIANYLGIYAKNILDFPQSYNFIQLLSAIYAYAVQIYCDFSGYVDLVCAFALMLGFTLPPNFNMPYLAKNLKEFWARWHISLSTFIRDYIYIPLGG
ncbi:MBOAT family protein, partial [Campylobacter coli]|nr:MBOAT family protein [Campylobacter coli]